MADHVMSTSCPMDCPDTCALDVSIRNGKVTTIRGARGTHPDTAGFICTKISRFARRVYHPDRLLHPLRRSGPKGSGRFERISWETAVTEIVTRFREIGAQWGPEAIMPFHYGGSNGFLGDELLDHYFFARLGASRCVKTLCAAPTSAVAAGMYGKMPGVAFGAYPQARFILLWGVNPKVSNIHLMPYLRRARRAGAFIAVVDPRRNYSAEEVDLHLPVYPGADLPLALGMIRFWEENNLLDDRFIAENVRNSETLLSAARDWPLEKAARAAGVDSTDVERLARQYAELSPAVLRCGWGLERNRNGGQAAAAVLAMPALLGKFGVPGGGYTMSNSSAARLDKAKVIGDLNWNSRSLNQTRLAALLNEPLEPPLKSLFVYNCNPLATVPDQNGVLKGLLREDLFTVVFEQVMTDTARYADILLPAVTFLEQQEIRRSYGSYVIGGIRPVIEPRGEAKSNEAVFAMLGRAMGWRDDVFQKETKELMADVSAALGTPQGAVPVEDLVAGKPYAYMGEEGHPVQFKTVFPRTADGKIDLAPPDLGNRPYEYHPVRAEKYPFALISPANEKMISSTLGEFNYPRLIVHIHPRDAADRGISSGDRVSVHNELGEVRCEALVSDAVRPGVLSMPKGAWRKSAANGQTSVALCPATINTVGGGACFNDARVAITRLE